MLGATSRIDVSGATEPRVIGLEGYWDMGTGGFQIERGDTSRAVRKIQQIGSGPALQLHKTSSSSEAALEILNADGSVGVASPASGMWKVFLGKKWLFSASAAPTTGTWARGDIAWNYEPSASGVIGWMCVTAGSPGTWKSFGAISA